MLSATFVPCYLVQQENVLRTNVLTRIVNQWNVKLFLNPYIFVCRNSYGKYQ